MDARAVCLFVVLLNVGSPAVVSAQAEDDPGRTSSVGREADGEDESDGQSSSRETPDWLKRGSRLLEGVTGDEAPRGFFPLFGTVSPGSGVAAGGGYYDYAFLGSPLGFELSAMVSVRNYGLYRARLGFLGSHRHTTHLRPPDAHVSSMLEDGGPNAPGISLYAETRYRYYAREHFYGIGPTSRPGDGTSYRVKGGAYDLVLEAQATRSLGFSARVGILESALGAGQDPDEPLTFERFPSNEVPGMVEQSRYVAAGMGVVFDTRENPHDPRDGVLLGAAAWRYDARGGRRFDFTRLAFDARTYVTPSRFPGVVAVRAVVSADLVAAGADVPFFLEQTLGGSQLLRSFPRSRFRDHALAHATVEYRLRPHPLIEVAPLLDVGTVGRTLAAFRARDATASFGIAVRPIWRERVLGRMEYVVGREGRRFVFAMGQAF